MPIFESKEKMKEVLGGLFHILLDDPEAGPKFAGSGITIKFEITDPDAQLFITPGDGVKGEVLWGKQEIAPTIVMKLSGDTCHKFWLKQLSMPIALAKGLIKAKGPMPKVLKLLPILAPAYAAYPDWAKSQGMPV